MICDVNDRVETSQLSTSIIHTSTDFNDCKSHSIFGSSSSYKNTFNGILELFSISCNCVFNATLGNINSILNASFNSESGDVIIVISFIVGAVYFPRKGAYVAFYICIFVFSYSLFWIRFFPLPLGCFLIFVLFIVV
jgi:hypothetical protein